MWPARQANRPLMAPRRPVDHRILINTLRELRQSQEKELSSSINQDDAFYQFDMLLSACSACAVGFNQKMLLDIWKLYRL